MIAALLLTSCTRTPEEDPPEDIVVGGTLISELAEKPLTELTSIEFARLMGYGINIGNTMEACNVDERVPMQDPSVYETMWGNPVTTQAMVDGMRAAGFKTLRVPVAWTNAMNFAVNNELDYENWDYTISDAYLDRVDEIINYALNAEMIVIINNHWDHGWWSMFGHKDESVREIAWEIYESMWTQVADRFKEYDNRIVFESANEELGKRLNDRTHFSLEGGNLTPANQYRTVTAINQKFVDIVRDTGGNNAERFLLVKGFCTDVKATTDERYVMPEDPAGKLLLGVHYYTPWSYCGDTSGVMGWGTTGEVEEMNDNLKSLAKFTEQGYGIVLGEWGVLDNVGDDRVTFYTNFLDLCDKYGFVPMLWDTGGMYCRKTNVIKQDLNWKREDPAIDKIAALFKSRDINSRMDLTVEGLIASAEIGLAATLAKAADKPEFQFTADEAFAWIMWNGDLGAIQYSVGDQYRPEAIAEGLIANDVEITDGAGTYTVGLDFTETAKGYSDGFAFTALGIMNGEILFPGYVIEITEILINGEPAEINGKFYTTNDNKVTTRVNLYNEWVSSLPGEARTLDGDLEGTTWIPLANYKSAEIKTIEITFDYVER